MVKFKKITLDAAKDGVAIANRLLSVMMNRTPGPKHVKELANLMLGGHWKTNGSTEIVVTNTGKLVEGQHRLLAFIEAAQHNPNLKVSFWLKTGVPDEESYATQANIKHWTCGDMLEREGMDKTIGGVVKLILSKGSSSVCRSTHETILQKAKEWAGTIERVRNDIEDASRIKTAAVIAAIVRALIVTKRATAIRRFCEILSGESAAKSPVERWARQLYKDLNASARAPRNHDEVLRSYQKTEAALFGFLEGTPCYERQIRAARKEMFTLPGEIIFVPNDRTPRFLTSIRGAGKRTSAEAIKAVLADKVVSLQGKIQRRIPSGAKLALVTLADRRLVVVATVKGVVTSPTTGVQKLALLNATAVTPPKEIDFSKLSSYPRVPDISKEIVPITASDMENLKA